MLSELSDLDVTFPEWQDIIDELMPMVERYAFKEETILFPIARQVIDNKLAEAMAIDYQRMRNLPTRMNPTRGRLRGPGSPSMALTVSVRDRGWPQTTMD